MKIYAYRLDRKFGDLAGVDRLKPMERNLTYPCLIIFHGGKELVSDQWTTRREDILAKRVAVLTVNTEIQQKPVDCQTDMFHCLSYRIPSDQPNVSEKEKFEKLIAHVQGMEDWKSADMGAIWAIVERPAPQEALLAWYLVALAQSRGVAVDSHSLGAGFLIDAQDEFRRSGGYGELDLMSVREILQTRFRQ